MTKTIKQNENILIFSAHSDDFVLGAGGTILDYTKQGKNVTVIVFSYGEKALPWLKEQIAQKVRLQETLEASEMIGCNVVFFDLKEFHFLEDFKQKELEQKVLKIIAKEKPQKIFTHSHEDPHPDHKAAHTITLKIYEKIKSSVKPELYIYSVWNSVSFKEYPSLYVDISKTFFMKIKALRVFRSQRIPIAYPVFLSLYRAVIDGLKIRKRFAEKFFRIH